MNQSTNFTDINWDLNIPSSSQAYYSACMNLLKRLQNSKIPSSDAAKGWTQTEIEDLVKLWKSDRRFRSHASRLFPDILMGNGLSEAHTDHEAYQYMYEEVGMTPWDTSKLKIGDHHNPHAAGINAFDQRMRMECYEAKWGITFQLTESHPHGDVVIFPFRWTPHDTAAYRRNPSHQPATPDEIPDTEIGVLVTIKTLNPSFSTLNLHQPHQSPSLLVITTPRHNTVSPMDDVHVITPRQLLEHISRISHGDTAGGSLPTKPFSLENLVGLVLRLFHEGEARISPDREETTVRWDEVCRTKAEIAGAGGFVV